MNKEDATGVPEGWTHVRLGDIVERVANFRPEDEPDRIFNYVDISAIDNTTFEIREAEAIKGRQVPSRARRPIRAGDVLFSNVRTSLRNIALVRTETLADLCSTAFTVLRPTDAADSRYLFRYVLTNEFMDQVTPEQTGTHYPATTEKVVLDQVVLLPPLTEQRRIGEVLDKVFDRLTVVRGQL
jgi:type I restriction enzyme S subunit